ncbi:MAG: transglycosylase [Brevundimonas sp.]
MQYADIATAVLGALALAWLADLFTGRRGLFATSLVSGVAAVAGWFLAIRVFAIGTMDEWGWVVWSLAASALALGGFFLFRSKR